MRAKPPRSTPSRNATGRPASTTTWVRMAVSGSTPTATRTLMLSGTQSTASTPYVYSGASTRRCAAVARRNRLTRTTVVRHHDRGADRGLDASAGGGQVGPVGHEQHVVRRGLRGEQVARCLQHQTHRVARGGDRPARHGGESTAGKREQEVHHDRQRHGREHLADRDQGGRSPGCRARRATRRAHRRRAEVRSRYRVAAPRRRRRRPRTRGRGRAGAGRLPGRRGRRLSRASSTNARATAATAS